MNQTPRLTFPDTIKGLAVLLMIQVHIMEIFVREDIYNSITGQISLFLGGIPAAPVFMLMMGYFAAFKVKSPKKLIIRGIILFFGGILLNIGLNFHLIYKIIFQGVELNIWHFILGVDILSLSGLSLIFMGIILTLAKNRFYIWLILALVFAGLSQLWGPYQFENHPLSYLFAYITGGTSWSYFPLIPWLAYPLLGFGIQLIYEKYDLAKFTGKKWLLIPLAIILLVMIYTFDYGFTISTYLSFYYHHHLVFFLWATGFMVLWFYLIFRAEKIFSKTLFFKHLRFMGKNVTVIYIIQWLIIGNLGTAIYKTMSLSQCLLWFGAITLTTSLLTYIYLLIRKK